MENFNVGDIVYLKSGSPAMTVRKIRGRDTSNIVVMVDYFKHDYFNESLEFKIEELTKEMSTLILTFNQ